MDTSKFTAGAEHWAHGCDKCRYGLTYAPDTNTSQPLYIQRAVQAANTDITFCDCRAGQAMRSYLRRAWAAEIAGRPDLEAMREQVREETAAPPIRYVQGAA